mmetsp:Transcript_78017/g.253150  ORF Transcript_78017/g.253150 Transcript_78017/m.253150 type:complete len:215 (+) Transcript_78017:921-1565(+)
MPHWVVVSRPLRFWAATLICPLRQRTDSCRCCAAMGKQIKWFPQQQGSACQMPCAGRACPPSCVRTRAWATAPLRRRPPMSPASSARGSSPRVGRRRWDGSPLASSRVCCVTSAWIPRRATRRAICWTAPGPPCWPSERGAGSRFRRSQVSWLPVPPKHTTAVFCQLERVFGTLGFPCSAFAPLALHAHFVQPWSGELVLLGTVYRLYQLEMHC